MKGPSCWMGGGGGRGGGEGEDSDLNLKLLQKKKKNFITFRKRSLVFFVVKKKKELHCDKSTLA